MQEICCNLGRVLWDLGKAREAIKVLKKGEKSGPKNRKSRSLAYAHYMNGEWEQARRYYDAAAILEPTRKDRAVGKSLECSAHLKDLTRLRSDLEKAAIRQPINILASAISAYAAVNNTDGAICTHFAPDHWRG